MVHQNCKLVWVQLKRNYICESHVDFAQAVNKRTKSNLLIRRKEACASRRRTAVKHAVMRKFLSHCVRDQKGKVICTCKLHRRAHRHSFIFPRKWRHGLRLDLRPIYAQIYSHSFRNICFKYYLFNIHLLIFNI